MSYENVVYFDGEQTADLVSADTIVGPHIALLLGGGEDEQELAGEIIDLLTAYADFYYESADGQGRGDLPWDLPDGWAAAELDGHRLAWNASARCLRLDRVLAGRAAR